MQRELASLMEPIVMNTTRSKSIAQINTRCLASVLTHASRLQKRLALGSSLLCVVICLAVPSHAKAAGLDGSRPPEALQAWAATLQELHTEFHQLQNTAAQEANPVAARGMRAAAKDIETQYTSFFSNIEDRPDEVDLKQMLVEAVVMDFEQHDLGGGIVHLPLAVALCQPTWVATGNNTDTAIHVSAYSEFDSIPLPGSTIAWTTEPNPRTIVVPESSLGAAVFSELKAESPRERQMGSRLYLPLFVTSVEVSPIRSTFFSVRLTGLYSGVYITRGDAEAAMQAMNRKVLEEHRETLRVQMIEDVLHADATFATEIVQNLAVAGHERAGASPLERMANPISTSQRPFVVLTSDTQPPSFNGSSPAPMTQAVHNWFEDAITTPLSAVEYVLEGTPRARPLHSHDVSMDKWPITRTNVTVLEMPSEAEMIGHPADLRDATWTATVDVSGLASLTDWGGYTRIKQIFQPKPPPTAQMRSVQFASMDLPPDGEVFAVRRFGDVTIAVGMFTHNGANVQFLASSGDGMPWEPMNTRVSLGIGSRVWLFEHEGIPTVISSRMRADEADAPFWTARFTDGTWRPVELDKADFVSRAQNELWRQHRNSLPPNVAAQLPEHVPAVWTSSSSPPVQAPAEVSDQEYKAMSNKEKRRVLRERSEHKRAMQQVENQRRQTEQVIKQLHAAASALDINAAISAKDGLYVAASPSRMGIAGQMSGTFVFRLAGGRWESVGDNVKGIATSIHSRKRTLITVASSHLQTEKLWVMELVGGRWVDRRDGLAPNAAIRAIAQMGDYVVAISSVGVYKLTNDTWERVEYSGEYAIVDIEAADVFPSGRILGRGKLVHHETGRPFNGVFEVDTNRFVPVTQESTYGTRYDLPRVTQSTVIAETENAILLKKDNRAPLAVAIERKTVPVPIGTTHASREFTIVDRRHATMRDGLESRRAELLDQLRDNALHRSWKLVRR